MNAHTRPPGEPQDAPLYRRTDIAPEIFFQALGRARKAARDEIERLIEWLDSTIDIDEDCAIDDEPCDGEGDLEPALGSFDRMSNQIKAWQTTDLIAAQEDRELDDSDNEESDPREASLGSLDGQADQTAWAAGGRRDLELDPAETGIVDLDALLEQVGYSST